MLEGLIIIGSLVSFAGLAVVTGKDSRDGEDWYRHGPRQGPPNRSL